MERVRLRHIPARLHHIITNNIPGLQFQIYFFGSHQQETERPDSLLDLAIEFLDDLCTWEKTKPLYERIVRELAELGANPRRNKFEQEKYAKLLEAEEIIPSLKDQIDGATASMRNKEDFYDLERYMGALRNAGLPE